MAGDRINGIDVHGHPYDVRGPELITNRAHEAGAVVSVFAERGADLDAATSARVATFLLTAAKVDLVGAARRVVELHAGAHTVHVPTNRLLERYHVEISAIAAELAKLDAMVGHDMSEETREK